MGRGAATSEWRLAENIYYPEDIQEVLAVLPPPAVLALPLSKQPSTIQAFLPPLEVAEGKEVGQGGPQPQDKGKGKEVEALPKAKGKKATLMVKDANPKAKDANSKVKDAAAKAKEADSKAKDVATKDDPACTKA